MKAITKSPSYLIRNPYSYCFRMVVPTDLQRRVGKTKLRYSLRTGYIDEAKYKARLLAGQVQYVFNSFLNSSPLHDRHIVPCGFATSPLSKLPPKAIGLHTQDPSNLTDISKYDKHESELNTDTTTILSQTGDTDYDV